MPCDADKLEMDHGKEMMQMVCTSYESPEADEMEEDYDFSEQLLPGCEAVAIK